MALCQTYPHHPHDCPGRWLTCPLLKLPMLIYWPALWFVWGKDVFVIGNGSWQIDENVHFKNIEYQRQVNVNIVSIDMKIPWLPSKILFTQVTEILSGHHSLESFSLSLKECDGSKQELIGLNGQYKLDIEIRWSLKAASTCFTDSEFRMKVQTLSNSNLATVN